MMLRIPCCRPVAVAALVLSLAVTDLNAAGPQQIPDFTEGDPIPESAEHDWNLGATGARGWMATDRLVTSVARQIKVTAVADDSPADGVLEVGDVLLGVGGAPFQSDPRTEFGRALTAAEARQGRLSVLRWRDGRRREVEIRLPVLGAYSDTAPYDCPKSERILERGCEALAARMQEPSYRPKPIPRCLNALALLASGNPRYLPVVRREVGWASDFSARGFQTWYYGYVCILLAEYSMATGDDSALDGLRRLVGEAVEGQSAVGSWGHKFAGDDGRLLGYGMMNAPGIPLTIGLVMAREAGVRGDGIDRAIRRSVDLLRFYAGKGAVPYGDHHPWIQTHEDNGKCGMATLLFDLLGDTGAARFFSRMSVASHGAERDCGHTGNFFNLLWSMPAVARSGPQATGAWMEEFGGWYFDLARRWDGSFCHLGPPQPRDDSYADWDASGAYLLGYAVPRRQLLLTGRPLGDRDAALQPIDADEAAALIDDGRGWSNRDRGSHYAALSDAELLERLGSWSPVVRERAAGALRRSGAEIVPALIDRLGSDEVAVRLGACQALAELRGAGAPAVDALRACLEADLLWLRVKAAEALGRIGAAAMPALPELLEALAREPGQDDPRGMEQRYLCFALFDQRQGLLPRRGVEGVDMEALYAAIRAGLQNQDGRARSAVANIYESLSFEQLEPLLPAIYEATMRPSPSGIMFADGVRMAGLRLMAKHRIEEGIAASAYYVQHMKPHGSEKRVPKVLEILESYGAHAQEAIPQLEQAVDYFLNEEEDFPKRLSRGKAEDVRGAIERIRAATARPRLRSLR